MIVRLAAMLALLWALGFAFFVITLPRARATQATDGVIVLTGGPGRLQRGLATLRGHQARRMLISGVDAQVRPRELAAAYHIPAALMRSIDLGHQSVDTRSNADEAAAWIADHGYRSVRLVTTDWHMPRARLELARVARGGVTVLPDPVASHSALRVLLREYNKYLLRRAAAIAGY